MNDLGKTADRLCALSRRAFSNPFADFQWPERLDGDQWSTSPELISIYGSQAYEAMSEPERKRLSFYEAVNFFSLNIHGEKALVEGLAARLYRGGEDVISPYLHHFLDEENKHMVYFAGYCQRYAGKIYPDRKMAFPREYAEGEEDFLFFGKVLIFEEIVDVYNVRMAKDERVAPLAREINRLHHLDEARHLAFGRVLVSELFERFRARWSSETLRGVREYLAAYFVATWKEYYNPDVYRDAGLPDPFKIHRETFQSERARAHRKEISAKCVHYLLEKEILAEEPAL